MIKVGDLIGDVHANQYSWCGVATSIRNGDVSGPYETRHPYHGGEVRGDHHGDICDAASNLYITIRRSSQ